MTDDLILNVAYFMVSICVMYKMAWIARMTAHIAGWQSRGLKFGGAMLAGVIMFKGAWRFVEPGDAATLVDVTRELSLCFFLFFAIATLRRRTGHW